MDYKIYHTTLSAALSEAFSHSVNRRAEVSRDDLFEAFGNGVAYNETVEVHLPIFALKGKGTKKYFHAIIYRMSLGSYELTSYIL